MTKLLIRLISALVFIILGAGLALWGSSYLGSFNPVKVETEQSTSQVIESIKTEEQVVLVSLGIQGITDRKETGKFFSWDIPGTTKNSFLQYQFSAKLGIEGKDVEFQRISEDEYLVKVPEFIFIGHDKVNFKLVNEKNGILSFVTPNIDTLDMVNEILGDDEQHEFIELNSDLLKDQAKQFYTSIVSGLAPNVKLQFEFTE